MAATARLIEPGPKRDAVIARNFATELWKLLQPDFSRLDAATRSRICAGVARACEAYLTPDECRPIVMTCRSTAEGADGTQFVRSILIRLPV